MNLLDVLSLLFFKFTTFGSLYMLFGGLIAVVLIGDSKEIDINKSTFLFIALWPIVIITAVICFAIYSFRSLLKRGR